MIIENFDRVEEVFHGARHREGSERTTFLDRACAGERELRRQVEALLNEDASPFPLDRAMDIPIEGIPCKPERVGHYRITRLIATGGMGRVFEAEQEDPQRTVAVKVMRSAMASPSAQRRFRYESEVLARLRHPGIAQVFEVGTFDDGTGAVPFFAMEYVAGAAPITDYATKRALSRRERLGLFTEVCEAVQHGHQKGVTHRDLKPDNILVDEAGRATIIDFGIARATDSDLAATTAHTDAGQVLGTLQYMSPEQCRSDAQQIDTRSDVYALGAVLHELLSDERPYDVAGLAIHEATRVVCEAAPTRLGAIDPSLRGDLETIVLKALEKEPDRRYQTALELTQDVNNYLAGRAVTARRPSTTYRFRVLVRRNKALAASLAALFVVLMTGIAVAASMYVGAESARTETAQEVAKLAAVNEFVNEMLTAADAEVARGRQVTVEEVLDNASRRIAPALGGEPEVEAEVRMTLGSTFMSLLMFDDAEANFASALSLRRAALGPQHADIAESLAWLGRLRDHQKRYDEALVLLRQSLAMQRSLGIEHGPLPARTWLFLAPSLCSQGDHQGCREAALRAIDMYRELPGEHAREIAWALNSIGLAAPSPEEAERVHREALALRLEALGEDHPHVTFSLILLGHALREQGRFREAEDNYSRAVDLERAARGGMYPNTILAQWGLARALSAQGRLVDAERVAREAVERKRYWRTVTGLGLVLAEKGDRVEAERLLREALELRWASSGRDPVGDARSLAHLAVVLRNQGDLEGAEAALRAALRTIDDGQRPDYRATRAICRCELGACLTRMGRFEEAERELLPGWEALDQNPWTRHVRARKAARHVVALYEAWDRPALARDWRARVARGE